MALEESRFFDSVENDNSYYADDFAEYFRMFLTNGVWSLGDNLKVSPGNGVSVTVNYGAAMIRGYGYWLKEDGGDMKQMNLSTGLSQPRIDRVVLRLDTHCKPGELYLRFWRGNRRQSRLHLVSPGAATFTSFPWHRCASERMRSRFLRRISPTSGEMRSFAAL